MGKIKIEDIIILNNTIEVKYNVSNDLQELFNLNYTFKIEYSEKISSVPKNIAIIPFVSNILPIAWLSNSDLYIDELEENFANCLDDLRDAFNKINKTDIFKGNIIVNKKIKNSKYSNTKNISCFWSGGVDSLQTLTYLLKQDYKPLLITLWGTDVWHHNEAGWNSLKNNSELCGKTFGLKNIYVKSNFRNFIKEHILTEKLLKDRINDSWWHGIQHGIGLLGHIAPYTYIYIIYKFTIFLEH